MSSPGILLLSLSTQSTGEVRFFTTSLKAAGCMPESIHLLLDASLVGMFSDFPGTVHPVSWPAKLRPEDVLDRLRGHAGRFRKLILLDLHSAILEYSWGHDRTESLLAALDREYPSALSLYDVMGVLEKDESRLEARRERTSEAVDAFIGENLKVPGKASVKKSYYFARYLKPRTMNQLVKVPESIDIYRSVPYTYPTDPGDGAIYFRCHFEKVAPVESRAGKAVVGFSKMTLNLIPGDSLRELFTYVAERLRDRMGMRSLVVIEPCGFLGAEDAPAGMEFEVHRRMARDPFLRHLSESQFAGFFIPTASVGVTAIQNGIPFVNFFSTLDSSEFVSHKWPANGVPRFTSLGIWEDLAYIGELLRPANAYFQAVHGVDISRPDDFDRCGRDLEEGRLKERVGRYLESDRDGKPFPDFAQAVLQ